MRQPENTPTSDVTMEQETPAERRSALREAWITGDVRLGPTQQERPHAGGQPLASHGIAHLAEATLELCPSLSCWSEVLGEHQTMDAVGRIRAGAVTFDAPVS